MLSGVLKILDLTHDASYQEPPRFELELFDSVNERIIGRSAVCGQPQIVANRKLLGGEP
jgi:hypothetical protein